MDKGSDELFQLQQQQIPPQQFQQQQFQQQQFQQQQFQQQQFQQQQFQQQQFQQQHPTYLSNENPTSLSQEHRIFQESQLPTNVHSGNMTSETHSSIIYNASPITTSQPFPQQINKEEIPSSSPIQQPQIIHNDLEPQNIVIVQETSPLPLNNVIITEKGFDNVVGQVDHSIPAVD